MTSTRIDIFTEYTDESGRLVQVDVRRWQGKHCPLCAVDILSHSWIDVEDGSSAKEIMCDDEFSRAVRCSFSCPTCGDAQCTGGGIYHPCTTDDQRAYLEWLDVQNGL